MSRRDDSVLYSFRVSTFTSGSMSACHCPTSGLTVFQSSPSFSKVSKIVRPSGSMVMRSLRHLHSTPSGPA